MPSPPKKTSDASSSKTGKTRSSRFQSARHPTRARVTSLPLSVRPTRQIQRQLEQALTVAETRDVERLVVRAAEGDVGRGLHFGHRDGADHRAIRLVHD